MDLSWWNWPTAVATMGAYFAVGIVAFCIEEVKNHSVKTRRGREAERLLSEAFGNASSLREAAAAQAQGDPIRIEDPPLIEHLQNVSEAIHSSSAELAQLLAKVDEAVAAQSEAARAAAVDRAAILLDYHVLRESYEALASMSPEQATAIQQYLDEAGDRTHRRTVLWGFIWFLCGAIVSVAGTLLLSS